MTGEGIDTQAALTISAAVVALATLIRWAAPGDSISGTRALLVVCGLSALGVALWVLSLPAPPSRQWMFGIFQAWISVSLQAAGVYGFANASTRSLPAHDPTQSMRDDPTVKEYVAKQPPHPLAGMPPRRGPQFP